MSNKKKHTWGSFPVVNVVFSTTVALIMMGVFLILAIVIDNVSENFIRHRTVHLFLERDANDQIDHTSVTSSFREYLDKLRENDDPVQLVTDFVSKQQTTDQFKADLGENYLESTGQNPFKDLLTIQIISPELTEGEFDKLLTFISSDNRVYQTVHHHKLYKDLARNLRNIALIIILFLTAFVVVTLLLINNSIRLAMYSQRFLIRSMQLVGATPGFIKQPFLQKAIIIGLSGGFLASFVSTLIYIWSYPVLSSSNLLNTGEFLFVVASLFLFGLLINTISVYISTSRYLKLSLEELY
jgi:cell division transport system permease protein